MALTYGQTEGIYKGSVFAILQRILKKIEIPILVFIKPKHLVGYIIGYNRVFTHLWILTQVLTHL